MDRWIPYLFQNNIMCLDVPDQIKCLTGLVGADVDKAITNVLNKTVAGGWGPNAIFRFPKEVREVGVALTRRYLDSNNNSKNIFALRFITMPVSRFAFFTGRHRSRPTWKNVSKNCDPQDKQQYNSKVVKISAAEKKVTLEKSDVITSYDKLLSTTPLDMTLRMFAESEAEDVMAKCRSCADTLAYSSSHIIGIGLRGVNPHDTKCWLYYPEDNCPFYR